jgi:hypothetical protein
MLALPHRFAPPTMPREIAADDAMYAVNASNDHYLQVGLSARAIVEAAMGTMTLARFSARRAATVVPGADPVQHVLARGRQESRRFRSPRPCRLERNIVVQIAGLRSIP